MLNKIPKGVLIQTMHKVRNRNFIKICYPKREFQSWLNMLRTHCYAMDLSQYYTASPNKHGNSVTTFSYYTNSYLGLVLFSLKSHV